MLNFPDMNIVKFPQFVKSMILGPNQEAT